MNEMNKNKINDALGLLGEILEYEKAGTFSIVICGGASLISTSLIPRTTQDVDIIAMMDSKSNLTSPDPLPENLMAIAERVKENLNLPDNWLNNGPSKENGGLFQMGLPEGFKSRLQKVSFGGALTVYYISRVDQIFFKLYAAADQGAGRHSSDLQKLAPRDDELFMGCQWAMEHDPSDGFRQVLIEMLKALGYENVIQRL